MSQRVITAVIALIFFIPIVYVGGLVLELLAAVLAVIGVYELFKMKGLSLFSFEGIVAACGALFLVLPINNWFFFLPIKTNNFMLFYLVVLVLLASMVFSHNTYTFDEAAFPVLVSLYVGTGFQNFVLARQAGLTVLLYALFIVWATDIGAYMIGRQIGKTPLAPDISPNKTIEGSVGGLICAVIVSLLFLLAFPAKYYFTYGTVTMLLLTLVFSAAGQLGDLVESAYKRHYNVKDSGNILPGHGGILDRFDSLLFVFPLMHLLGVF